MTARELVSVVVTTRNSARTLRECLGSIRAQTYEPIELVVVDNASSDATASVASEYADSVIQAGPERCAQRNAGIAASSGEYVLVLDGDMVVDPQVVASCVERCAGTDGVAVDRAQSGRGFWARCKSLEADLYHGDRVVSAARFFRRRALLEVGGYDEALLGGDDWDVSMRVMRERPLPFADGCIRNDEGTVRLSERFLKQIYYGSSWRRFTKKHGAAALRRLNPARGAFLRNMPRLARHPVLAAGLVILKSTELAGALVGAAAGGLVDHRRLYGD